MVRTLVIAAHPDDESLGAASLLTSLDSCGVLHLTDGAPLDPHFWPTRAPATRDAYARQRREEALRALSLAKVDPDEIHCLGLVDLELSTGLVDLARELSYWMMALKPELVVTHAYEGGHPDNDSAAFAVAAAADLVARCGQRAPAVLEMALYHGAPGGLAIGQFVASDTVAPPQIECAFTEAALERKHEMLRCFETQADTLRPFFALTRERFRPAPRYDFSLPPHFGPLYYEQSGFPIEGCEWRGRAAEARRELAL